MKKNLIIRVVFIKILLLGFCPKILGDENLVGVWEASGNNIRLEILEGFKPNRGVVLRIKDADDFSVGTWIATDEGITLKMGFSGSLINFNTTEKFTWRGINFNKKKEVSNTPFIQLKNNKNEFISKLILNKWQIFFSYGLSRDKGEAEFSTTFSNDSGVLAIAGDNNKEGIYPWSISSGLLKFMGILVLEARISDNYFLGKNQNDTIYIFKSKGKSETVTKANLNLDKEKILSSLVTDSWLKNDKINKFRPIEGPLLGRVIVTNPKNELYTTYEWEYSPSTKSIRINNNIYNAAILIDDKLLALLDKNGDQTFYKRKSGGPGKVYTTADVTKLEINEYNLEKIKTFLSGQFNDSAKYLYSFEFSDNKRNGFLHKWKSSPFSIIGQHIKSELISDFREVYSVEDILFFKNKRTSYRSESELQRNVSQSRLKPKKESEVLDDQTQLIQNLSNLNKKKLKLRLTDISGTVKDILLPIDSLKEISKLEFVAE